MPVSVMTLMGREGFRSEEKQEKLQNLVTVFNNLAMQYSNTAGGGRLR